MRFFTADVFTERMFGGNQLAVFPDATGIPGSGSYRPTTASLTMPSLWTRSLALGSGSCAVIHCVSAIDRQSDRVGTRSKPVRYHWLTCRSRTNNCLRIRRPNGCGNG